MRCWRVTGAPVPPIWELGYRVGDFSSEATPYLLCLPGRRALRRRAIRIAQQHGDDVARALPAGLGDPGEPTRVLALPADDDPQGRGRAALVVLERA
jgi:hypothetical protein